MSIRQHVISAQSVGKLMMTTEFQKGPGGSDSHRERLKALKRVSMRMCAFYFLLDDKK